MAPFSMAVPVAGFLGSWLVLGERPDPAEVALGAVVVVAVVWGMTPRRREERVSRTLVGNTRGAIGGETIRSRASAI